MEYSVDYLREIGQIEEKILEKHRNKGKLFVWYIRLHHNIFLCR